MCLSFTTVHLLRGRGPAFVREPRRFPVLARLAVSRSIRRGVTGCLTDASSVARPRVTARGLTFSVPDALSNSVVIVAPQLGREEYPPLLFRPTLIIRKVNEALAMR